MTPRWQKILKEYAEAMIIALILAMIIRTFFIQAFKIPSGSMLDTLQIGDYLLVNKMSYGIKAPFMEKLLVRFDGPKHGDIIVFEYPQDPDMDFIKRVIGVPGDVIEIKDKEVYRNGEKLDEPFTRHSDSSIQKGERDFKAPFTVPEDNFFVLGDNRDDSRDSRFWGFVSRGKIRGKALILYWSWKSLTEIRWSRIGQLVK